MTTDWVVRGTVRLRITYFDNGWTWHAWEARTTDGWYALPPPARENQRRRFRAQHEAADFFLLLGDFLLETGTASPLISSTPVSPC
jgi:hypothetical protein